jgi:hypothetical protein
MHEDITDEMLRDIDSLIWRNVYLFLQHEEKKTSVRDIF